MGGLLGGGDNGKSQAKATREAAERQAQATLQAAREQIEAQNRQAAAQNQWSGQQAEQQREFEAQLNQTNQQYQSTLQAQQLAQQKALTDQTNAINKAYQDKMASLQQQANEQQQFEYTQQLLQSSADAQRQQALKDAQDATWMPQEQVEVTLAPDSSTYVDEQRRRRPVSDLYNGAGNVNTASTNKSSTSGTGLSSGLRI